ncbi:hypothetical protein DNTS_016098 [Danionella cerebrum]|uniref:C2 domain-containing protein n=1 Tax=Danionella cerebrum TaxID=2873325 RepID=A0A553Q647_9TELE|nr:hypothetical protein DNTS_016098 [Danionella translucida]
MSLAEQSQQWLPTSARVTVLQARGLRAKGKNGTNDAYAVMQLGKDKFVTAVAEKSAAPVWKEQASFELPVCSGNGSLQVCVLHRALVGPDKTLGTADINLQELREDPCRSKPQWFKLMGKSGKADKERGEVLLDIKFMRNHMTASMFDLSQEKSRSRLSKLKDKLKGRKKDGFSDSASAIVASPAQILTDSEPEEEPETTSGARKKSKLKSLFVPKPGLHRNMSQSMSTLTTLSEKDSNISLRRSSGLNAESPEGKKKFWILKHKHSGSSDSKVSQETGSLGIIQSNVCINGSHIYTEKTEPRNSRPGSTVSLNSSGHGSMEELRRGNDRKTSMDSPEETLRRQGQEIKKHEQESKKEELIKEEELRKHEDEVREKNVERRQNEQKKQEELKRQEEDIKKQEEELMEQEKLRKHEEEVRNTKMEMTKDEIMKQKELRKQEEEVRIRGNKRRKDELMKQEEDISKQQEEENKRFEDERRQTEQKRINIEGEHERMQMEIGMLENSEEKKRLESEEEIKTEREEERSLNEKWKLEKQEEGERLMTVEEEMRKEKDKQKIAKQEAEQRTTDEGEGMRIRNEEDLLKITNELEVDPKKEEKRKRKARKEEGGWGNLEVEERPKPESDDHQNDEEARKHEEERKCTKEKERIDFEKITFQGKISAAEEKRQKEKADEESMKLVKEERPAVKPRSARTNKKQSDGSPERNPVTSSTEPLSWDGIPTNPFEIIDDHPPRAVDRYRVSAVKPSSLLSQASVSNTKPFLEDSDSDTEHFVSPREKSEKKRQAPMPPKNKMPVKNPNSLPEEPVNNQASQGFGSDVDSCKLRQHKRLAPLPPNVSKDRQHVGSEHSHQFTSMLCTGILEKNQMKMNSALQETLVYLIDQSPREASNPFTDKLHHSSNFENQSVTEEHSCNTGHGEDLYNVECLNGDVEPKTENSQHDICASKKKNRAPLPPVKSEPNLNLNSTDEEVVSIQTSEPGDKHGLSQSKKNTSLAIKTTEEQMKTLKLEMVQGPGQRALPQAKVSPIEVGQNNRGEREKRGDHYIKPCRPHAVKPLNSSETPSETQGFSRTLPDVTDDVLRLSEGTFSQLTHAELISLIEKQKKQLSQKDSKIVELEQYIDDLLVRVMEENPSILMSLKKTA